MTGALANYPTTPPICQKTSKPRIVLLNPLASKPPKETKGVLIVSKQTKLYKDLMREIQNLADQTPCQQNPDYWDDDLPGVDWETRKQQVAGAKVLCNDCPVKWLCREYAVTANEPTGVWGGLSTVDREKLVTGSL